MNGCHFLQTRMNMNSHQRLSVPNSVPSLLLAGLLTFASHGFAQTKNGAGPEASGPNASGPDTIDRLASELPRVAPREPLDSLKQIRIRDGFHVELVAAEPLVRDPVAVDFDENGRMYVVQLPEYNAYAVKGFQDSGSIRMLEDTDARIARSNPCS